jgi:hypothetical protein
VAAVFKEDVKPWEGECLLTALSLPTPNTHQAVS